MGNKDFEICARAVIINNGEVLVCKKKDNNYYFFPGGHVEFGEKTEQALVRELNEELNIFIKEFSFVGIVENIYEEDDENHHEINLVFEVSADRVEDKSREDHIDFFFLDEEKFSKEIILPKALKKAVIQWQKDGQIFWKSNNETRKEFLKDSVSAIIIRKQDDKVFIVRRKENKEFSPGLWETIGGRIEKCETTEVALKREVKEELGVDIKSFKFFGDYEYREFNKLFKTYIIELEKEPTPSEPDFEEWGWFSEEEIKKLDFAANCKERILDYYKSIKYNL